MADDRLIIGGYEFKSRLFVGTGKYKDFAETKKAIEASGADVVTVAVRRVNITDRSNISIRRSTPFFPIPPAATTWKMLCAMPAWPEPPACRI
jgi:thiazole synthase ThiGH ThiG subunit